MSRKLIFFIFNKHSHSYLYSAMNELQVEQNKLANLSYQNVKINLEFTDIKIDEDNAEVKVLLSCDYNHSSTPIVEQKNIVFES